MYNLAIISSSVRPGRKGPIVAEWITGLARQTGQFNTDLIDLGVVNLPMMNEPQHPRLQQYTHDYTKEWSARIANADAFIFVTAEYNHSFPAPIKNALDYLVMEWGYKPVGFVSYGGISAGTRATNALKEVVTALKMTPLPEAVHIPMFTQFINEDNTFVANPPTVQGAELLLKELQRWTKYLQPIRNDT